MGSGMESYKRFISEKQRKQSAMDLASWEKAISDNNKIIDMIIRDFNPRRIFQWGSILCKEKWKQYSDIDIALEGITDAESFFHLLGKAMKLTDFPIDIVQIEKIEPEYAEIIKIKGRIVYER